MSFNQRWVDKLTTSCYCGSSLRQLHNTWSREKERRAVGPPTPATEVTTKAKEMAKWTSWGKRAAYRQSEALEAGMSTAPWIPSWEGTCVVGNDDNEDIQNSVHHRRRERLSLPWMDLDVGDPRPFLLTAVFKPAAEVVSLEPLRTRILAFRRFFLQCYGNQNELQHL